MLVIKFLFFVLPNKRKLIIQYVYTHIHNTLEKNKNVGHIFSWEQRNFVYNITYIHTVYILPKSTLLIYTKIVLLYNSFILFIVTVCMYNIYFYTEYFIQYIHSVFFVFL
jgi:hypothetical protein